MPLDIGIFDYIGFYEDSESSPAGLLKALNSEKPTDQIVVHINSFGGFALDGITMYNLLRNYKDKTCLLYPNFNIEVRIEGVAMSAASIIAMAGDKIKMGLSTTMMIHNAAVVAWGNKTDLRNAANELEVTDKKICNIYNKRTGIECAKLASMMDAETYMTEQEALDNKFIDSIDESAKATNIVIPFNCGEYDKFIREEYKNKLERSRKTKTTEKSTACKPDFDSMLLEAKILIGEHDASY